MQSEFMTGVTPMLSEQYARRVYCSSFLAIVSMMVAFNFKLYDFMFFATLVWINSINYWRHPMASWRRNLDMAVAFSACTYQIVASFNLHSQPYFVAYWITLSIAVYSYAMARRHGRKYLDFDRASKWHVNLHVFGNVSNILLYYGFSLQQQGVY
jgi:hypothetical protein